MDLPFNIAVIAFSGENGVPFPITYDLLGYLEMQGDPGPALHESSIPVAAVTAIAGQKRIELIFTEVAANAGTLPLHMHRGALYAAAECISAIEDFALDLTTSIVATVSKLDIAGAARDVIPGSIKCTLDIKSADTVRLTFACNALQNIFSEICDDRKIAFNWSTICETDPIACDTNLTNLLKQSIKNAGIDVVELVSGTSHNALPMAAICPVSILRMRCVKVISDAAAKDAEIKDIAASIEVAENFILNMAPMYN